MAAQLESQAPERVALLGRDDEVRAQLRAALAEAGADIVVEDDPREVDVDTLRSESISTLIVNLDAALDDAVERLDPLLDEPGIQVLFNESEVTQRLSGWDLARWARHLVSKALRRSDTTPPPPPGAESLPLRDLQPEPRAQAVPTPVTDEPDGFDDFEAEARLSVEVVPDSRLPEFDATPAPRASDEAEPAPIIGVELEMPEAEIDFDLPSVSLEKPMPETASAQYLDPGEVLEIDDFELVPHDEIAPEPRRLGPDEPTVVLSRHELHEQLSVTADEVDRDLLAPRLGNDAPTVVLDRAEIEAGLEALSQPAETLDVAPASSAYIEASDEDLDGGLDDFEGLLDFDENATGPLPTTSDEDDVDLSLDADVAALAAQLDALNESAPASAPLVEAFDGDADDLSGFDIDFDLPEPEPEPAAPVASLDEPAPEPAPARPAPSQPSTGFGELSLLDMDADVSAPAAPVAEKSSRFDFDIGGLSLEPLEGEQAAAGAAVEGIQRVIVLGASIGGPDALRSFLGVIPADFPALFVLVQHLENGFFARLAEQLQKASALQVRVAGADAAPAKMGEVLVLPSDARYSVQRDGQIVRQDYADPPRYKPCIDDAFKAVADVFGKDALAIIFSGMAGDAVEGASHVTAMGGEVWGQDPSSCVVSSMIDGAQARGLLEVLGSPRELAEQLVARFVTH